MTLRERFAGTDILTSTMLKTPAFEVVEVLAMAGFDFLTLDAEHAPFDRQRIDSCLAVARAKGVPTLVRVPDHSPSATLQALDSGATGVIVPHVDRVDIARAVACQARFGAGGRGYAGSTRWAGFATRPMAELLAQSQRETLVIAQIEDPGGLEMAGEIAQVDGIDALFFGPADVAVCLGEQSMTAPRVVAALSDVAAAARAAGKRCLTFVADAQAVPPLIAQGVTGFFVASEHAFMLNGAKAAVRDLRAAQQAGQ